jgi:prepilin-type N-terminal cleavage/methylation domain-containing protein
MSITLNTQSMTPTHAPNRQRGFTLIEIAIVLVIIGLLLGGILKGQELITGARVKNLINQTDGVKTAYFAFQDRYRALPGDYSAASTNIPNAAQNSEGDGDGQIEAGSESIAVWDHLSKSGFITGTYVFNATESDATTPKNPYGTYIQLVFDKVYSNGAGSSRHNLKTGNQVPVGIIAEVDRKIDDGNGQSGSFQFSAYAGGGGVAPTGGTCFLAAAAAGTWDVGGGETNCGGASLL